MLVKSFFLFLVLIIQNQLFAQLDSLGKPKVFLSLHAKYGAKEKLFFTDQIWEKYMPEYKNPHDSLGFTREQDNQDFNIGFFTFQIDREIKFDSIKNDKLSNRIGFLFGFHPGGYGLKEYYKTVKIPYDTMTSSQTGQQTFLTYDSIIRKSWSYESTSFQIGLSWMTYLDINPKWQIGLGLNLAYSFSLINRFIYRENTFITNNPSVDQPEVEKFEFEQKTNFPVLQTINFVIPFEVSFTPWNKRRKFISRWSNFFQIAPNFIVYTYDGNFHYQNDFILTFGIRLRLI